VKRNRRASYEKNISVVKKKPENSTKKKKVSVIGERLHKRKKMRDRPKRRKKKRPRKLKRGLSPWKTKWGSEEKPANDLRKGVGENASSAGETLLKGLVKKTKKQKIMHRRKFQRMPPE